MSGYVKIGGRTWRFSLWGDRLVIGQHEWRTARGREKATGREFWRAQRGKVVVFLTIGTAGLDVAQEPVARLRRA